MSVRVMKSGRCFVDTRWPDGMRTRSFMPDPATADRINKKIEVAIVDEERIWRRLRRELRLEKIQAVSFDDLADHYFKQYVKSYNRDVKGKESRLDILKAIFGGRSIEAMGPQAISSFVASRRDAGLKNATINRYLALLKHMMAWALRQGIIEINPISDIEKLKEPEWIGTRPDESLIDSVLDKIDSRALPIFVFMRETGCRRGEAIALKR